MASMRALLGLLIVMAVAMCAEEKHGCEAAPRSSTKNPVSWDEKLGTRTYMERCRVCHAASGQGGAKSSVSLDTERVKNCSDSSIFWLISNGSPGLMPAFRDVKEDDRWQLVHFIRKVIEKR